MRALVIDGRDKGFLTYDEIVGVLEEAEVTKEQIEDFYSHLLEVGIEVLDADGEVIAAGPRDPAPSAPRSSTSRSSRASTACASTSARSGGCRCSRPSRRWPSPSASSAAT